MDFSFSRSCITFNFMILLYFCTCTFTLILVGASNHTINKISTLKIRGIILWVRTIYQPTMFIIPYLILVNQSLDNVGLSLNS